MSSERARNTGDGQHRSDGPGSGAVRAATTDGEIDDHRFQSLFTAIDEGYCLCEIVLDDHGTPVDYRFLEANPLFEEMTGLHDPVGRTALDLVPGLEPHWVETYARAALGGERIRFEQGSEVMGRWFDVFTMPIEPHGRFAIVFKDESARRRAELALKESERRYRQLAEHERRNSLRLQHALLPAGVVDHPQFEIAARYEAVTESNAVGGDWFDTFIWPDGRLGLMVGDVVGHNLDAAAAMGHLRAGVAALAPHIESRPSAWIRALDECARGPNGTDWVTAVSVVVDPEARTVGACVAGHPPPVLVTPTGEITWLDRARSTPLGSIESDRTAEHVEPFEPGSVLVAYSDGLIERRSEPIDASLERLGRAVRDLRHLRPADLCEQLMAAMANDAPEDDVVVLVARHRDA